MKIATADEMKFVPQKLNLLRQQIQRDLFGFDEFYLQQRGNAPATAMQRATKILQNGLLGCALLSSKQLEDLLLYLPSASQEEAQIILTIMQARMSRRLALLSYHLYVHYHDVSAMQNLIDLAANRANEMNWQDQPLLAVLSGQTDKIAAIATKIVEYQADFNAYCKENSLPMQGNLARQVYFEFFKMASSEAMRRNLPLFAQFITPEMLMDDPQALLHYLRSLDPMQYDEKINEAILEKFGHPQQQEGPWLDFSYAMREKFLQWMYMHLLHNIYGNNSKKRRVLSTYLQRMKNVTWDKEKQIVVIDFGIFVIADGTIDSTDFYLYQKAVFEKEEMEVKSAGITPIFLREDHNLPSAREYFLENQQNDVMRLNCDSTGILYIQDLMDIQTGFAPDLRAVRNKNLFAKSTPKT